MSLALVTAHEEPAASLDADAALRALAHPGRRRVVQLVSVAPRTSGELAEACGWTRPATSQHLKVLKSAGLVEARVQGNRRLYRARPQALARLRAFLDDFWADRLAVLDEHIVSEQSTTANEPEGG